ncbi:MAG: hypothetical protein PHV63_01350 [Candidatus Daviesbacteria bacterium]|nr:hypothetical protein [Candidatus Daviesbacteria bacterium]
MTAEVPKQIAEIRQQIGALLDTGRVEVSGGKTRGLYLPASVFEQWPDVPHISRYALQNPEVDDVIRVKVSIQNPESVVADKRFLGVFNRQVIVYKPGFTSVELFARPRPTKWIFDPYIRWQYGLLIPLADKPILSVLEDELVYHRLDPGGPEEAYMYARTCRSTMLASAPTLEAFSLFLANVTDKFHTDSTSFCV